MLMLVKLILFNLVIAAISASTSFANDSRQIEEPDIFYSGIISAENNKKFFQSLHGKKFRRLQVTSSGGEVEAGIELGRWVFKHQLDVIVSGYCLSSCANYVFTAGVNKLIRPGAVVAWHGNYNHLLQTGAWRDDVDTRMQKFHESRKQAEGFVKNQVNQLVHLEKEFFSMIGVDESICWIAKMPPYHVSNYYFLSVKDMARFGVRHVTAPVDYVETDVSGLSVSVDYIKLPAR